MSIYIKYLPENNPEGHTLDAVPLRDMTAEEFAALPEQMQASVAACPFYDAVTAGGPPGEDSVTTPAELLALPGIGEEIALALAAAGYGTIELIRQATDAELRKIPGIGRKLLDGIRAALAQEVNDGV